MVGQAFSLLADIQQSARAVALRNSSSACADDAGGDPRRGSNPWNFRSHVAAGPLFGFGKQFGNITIDQYLHLAQQLRDATPGNLTFSFQTVRWRWIRSSISNAGGLSPSTGTASLRTFFVPKDGIRYFEAQQKSLVAPPEIEGCVAVLGYMATRSVNKAILIGNLGRDAETKFTPGGTAVTKLAVATSRRWKDKQSGEWKEETDWTNIVLWQAENLANYLTKGTRVYVEGRIHTCNYDDKDGKKVYATEVVADEVILLGGGKDGGGVGRGGGRRILATQPVSQPRSAQGVAHRVCLLAPQEDYGPCMGDDDVPF